MRVVSGSARGIKLETIEGLETRPTTDRIKEALFSMLHDQVYDKSVLDLFAGSGALGIEAASRGAKSVTSVDMSKKCVDVIKKNVLKTHLNDKMIVKRSDVSSFLNMANDTYDIIFMDPPYFEGFVDSTMEAILTRNILNDEGIIVVEHDFKDKICLSYEQLEIIKEKSMAGQPLRYLGGFHDQSGLSREFDPITNGHLDIVRRAARMFDEVVVAILVNSSKSPMFTIPERVELIKEATKDFKNVSVDHFDGLLVDYVKSQNSHVIVKGLRAIQDFEAEFQMAAVNRKLEADVDTCFIMTRTEYMYLSSSIVKEVAKYSSNINDFVPPCVAAAIKEKFGRE